MGENIAESLFTSHGAECGWSFAMVFLLPSNSCYGCWIRMDGCGIRDFIVNRKEIGRK